MDQDNTKRQETIFFQEQFTIDVAARTAPVEGPPIPAIGDAARAESAEAHAHLVEAPGGEALEEPEGRLMNAIRDVLKEVDSLGNMLTPLERSEMSKDESS